MSTELLSKSWHIPRALWPASLRTPRSRFHAHVDALRHSGLPMCNTSTDLNFHYLCAVDCPQRQRN
jgi:hypothetical protein